LIHGNPFVAARALTCAVWLLPALAGALEPRFDHRYQQGPTVEALAVKDIIWTGPASMTAQRGAVRVAWGFDPTGDGNELIFGSTFTALELSNTGDDKVRVALDARYRAYVGSEEFKTLLEVGAWGSVADRVAVGPLVGLGFIYDFSRNFGLLTSGFLAAAAGNSKIVSFGGGVGLQLRFE
jgi:hypothetical protein